MYNPKRAPGWHPGDPPLPPLGPGAPGWREPTDGRLTYRDYLRDDSLAKHMASELTAQIAVKSPRKVSDQNKEKREVRAQTFEAKEAVLKQRITQKKILQSQTQKELIASDASRKFVLENIDKRLQIAAVNRGALGDEAKVRKQKFGQLKEYADREKRDIAAKKARYEELERQMDADRKHNIRMANQLAAQMERERLQAELEAKNRAKQLAKEHQRIQDNAERQRIVTEAAQVAAEKVRKASERAEEKRIALGLEFASKKAMVDAEINGLRAAVETYRVKAGVPLIQTDDE